ncbi:MAG: CoA-binding protein [Actinomycetota bacterium]
MPTRSAIDEFLSGDPIAVVGVSRNPKHFANQVYCHLRDGGREMVPVHPIADAIEGDPCVRSVADLPDHVDRVLVMLGAEAAIPVVDACAERGVSHVWLHRGAGEGAVSAEAIDRCRDACIEVVDGACPLMFAEPIGWIHRAHRFVSGRRILTTT